MFCTPTFQFLIADTKALRALDVVAMRALRIDDRIPTFTTADFARHHFLLAAASLRPAARSLPKRNSIKRPTSDLIGLPFMAFVTQLRQRPLATAPALRHSSHLRSMSMLIVSPEFKCSNEILTITAMMSGMIIIKKVLFELKVNLTSIYPCSVPNIWLRPNNQRREADAAKARLTVPDGDHLTLLNVYNQYQLQSAFFI